MKFFLQKAKPKNQQEFDRVNVETLIKKTPFAAPREIELKDLTKIAGAPQVQNDWEG